MGVRETLIVGSWLAILAWIACGTFFLWPEIPTLAWFGIEFAGAVGIGLVFRLLHHLARRRFPESYIQS